MWVGFSNSKAKKEGGIDINSKEKAKITRRKNRILEQTKENMQALEVYRPEFLPTVERYAYMRVQYDMLLDQWYEDDCKITENYTNKSGATNVRKTALYMAIEAMRREILDIENTLGLTPKGLQNMKKKGLEKQKKSKLDALFGG